MTTTKKWAWRVRLPRGYRLTASILRPAVTRPSEGEDLPKPMTPDPGKVQ